jgi:hypothetical protein
MFKKFIVTALVCMSLPAGAEQLQGKVDYNKDQELKYQFPQVDSEDSIDWADWHKKFMLEIRRRLVLKANNGFPLDGKIRIICSVSREGTIADKITLDYSSNLGLLIPNILEEMQGNEVIEFPAGSQRQKVNMDMTISIGNRDYLRYMPDQEYVRNDRKTAESSTKTTQN